MGVLGVQIQTPRTCNESLQLLDIVCLATSSVPMKPNATTGFLLGLGFQPLPKMESFALFMAESFGCRMVDAGL